MSAALPPHEAVRRRRLQLVALTALFFGPLVSSAWLYYHGSWRPAGRVNHGELIDPPRPLPPLDLATPSGGHTGRSFLHRKWSLVTIAGGACEARCGEALTAMQTVRRALDLPGTRVERVLLTDAGGSPVAAPSAGPADLLTAWLGPGERRRLGATLAAARAPTAEAGRIYLVDPHGNLVMSYPPGADPRGVLQDLERLLRLSSIG